MFKKKNVQILTFNLNHLKYVYWNLLTLNSVKLIAGTRIKNVTAALI